MTPIRLQTIHGRILWVLQWTPMAIVAASALFLLLVLCFAVITITSLADHLLRQVTFVLPLLSSRVPHGYGGGAGLQGRTPTGLTAAPQVAQALP